MKKIRFINTFEPVAPLYDEVLPLLHAQGIDATALVSQAAYRQVGDRKQQYFSYLPAPKLSKRWIALFYMVLAPFRLLMQKVDVNVFLTQPPLFYIVGAFISRLTRTAYVIHIMDFYPDFLVRLGVLKEESWLFRLLKSASLWALKRAERIIVIGRCMKDYLLLLGLDETKIDVLPNWAARSLSPQAVRDNPFRKAQGLEDKFVVMYSGNMGTAHTLDGILSVAEKIKDSKVQFVFVGRGARRKEVEALLAKGQANISLLDYQPIEELAYSLSSADVHFMSLRNGFEGLMVPSKFYGVLACGRPVIYEGDLKGEVARVIHEADCGTAVAVADEAALESAIFSYLNSSAQVEEQGKNAQAVYKEQYHPDKGAKRYVECLLGLKRPLEEAQ